MPVAERRKQLEETARLLRRRLTDLEDRTRYVSDVERPMHEVAVMAVRDSLTHVGRDLVRLAA